MQHSNWEQQVAKIDTLVEISKLAGEIVITTPRKSRWSSRSYVSRQLIDELEKQLSKLYDMEKAREDYRRNRKLF